MTESKNPADLLELMLQTLTAHTALANRAHSQLGLDDATQFNAPCTSPEQLARQASELATSARETASNAASANHARGRQLDFLHAQTGALVQLSERYLTQVRQRRDVVQHQQHVTAIAYTSAAAGMQAESSTNQLAACVVALESFILVIRSLAHQSIAVVTTQMAAG